jgi:hypothetical protein
MAAKLAAAWRKVWILGLLAVAACDTAPALYYPLGEGRQWEYRLAIWQGDAAAPAVETPNRVANLALQELAGRTVTPQRAEAFGQVRVRFLAQDREGVFELAEQADPQAAPVLRDPVNYVVKRPLAAGTLWSSVWQSNQSGAVTLVPTTKTIAARDETVVVPAGRFSGCIKVAIRGAGEIPTAPGPTAIRVTGEEWFAPGVGFVRGIFREDVAGLPQNATRIEVTLVSHRQP